MTTTDSLTPTGSSVPRHLDRGEGSALVLVPGLAATAAFFTDTVAELARDHRVVVLELPGHGDRADEQPAGPTSLAQAAKDLRTLLEARDLTDVTLLGWSLGATVAWTYLERFGTDRVRALVSVDQTPCLLREENWPHAAFGGLDRAGAEGLLASVESDFAGFVGNLVGGSFAAGTTPAPGTLDRLLAEARRCSPASVRALLADAVEQDWRERLTPAVAGLPTLLLHGARSQVYPTPVGSWQADRLSTARLELLPESGHLPFLEEPERFHSALRAFLAAPGAGAVGPQNAPAAGRPA